VACGSQTRVADVRVLDTKVQGEYEAVVSFDNSLSHLLDDVDLHAAGRALRAVRRPGGIAMASIRDHAAILCDRPSGDPPRRFTSSTGERITFQVWDWISEDSYTLRHFVLTERTGAWEVAERRTTYRALTRAALSQALRSAGFEDVVWQMPEQSEHYQPIVTARVPT
jgi:glycine/sarcosine N-methyltransferase